jgi:hypothetical protein
MQAYAEGSKIGKAYKLADEHEKLRSHGRLQGSFPQSPRVAGAILDGMNIASKECLTKPRSLLGAISEYGDDAAIRSVDGVFGALDSGGRRQANLKLPPRFVRGGRADVKENALDARIVGTRRRSEIRPAARGCGSVEFPSGRSRPTTLCYSRLAVRSGPGKKRSGEMFAIS